MKERLNGILDKLRDRWSDERLQRRAYIVCTAAALAASGLILASIAHSEATAASETPHAAPSPAIISSAPDEGETLPLGRTDDVSPPPNASQVGESAPLGGETEEPAGDAVSLELELSDGEASGLLALALREKIETESVAASFAAPDTLAVSVAATRDALHDFLEREDTGVPSVLTALLPETLTLDIELGIAADGNGKVSLEPRSFVTCGLELTSYLPASLVALASEAVNSAIPDETPIKSVEVRDGSAVFLLDL